MVLIFFFFSPMFLFPLKEKYVFCGTSVYPMLKYLNSSGASLPSLSEGACPAPRWFLSSFSAVSRVKWAQACLGLQRALITRCKLLRSVGKLRFCTSRGDELNVSTNSFKKQTNKEKLPRALFIQAYFDVTLEKRSGDSALYLPSLS